MSKGVKITLEIGSTIFMVPRILGIPSSCCPFLFLFLPYHKSPEGPEELPPLEMALRAAVLYR